MNSSKHCSVTSLLRARLRIRRSDRRNQVLAEFWTMTRPAVFIKGSGYVFDPYEKKDKEKQPENRFLKIHHIIGGTYNDNGTSFFIITLIVSIIVPFGYHLLGEKRENVIKEQ